MALPCPRAILYDECSLNFSGNLFSKLNTFLSLLTFQHARIARFALDYFVSSVSILLCCVVVALE